MRELFLGFYKNLSYKELIYISFVELISKNMGSFHNNKIEIQKNSHFAKNEIKILHKMHLYTNGKLFPSELEDWYKEIQNELIKKGYLKKYPFFGYIFTGLFKNDIKIYIKSYFDYNIVEFINSRKIECLKPIINNIEKIKVPICDEIDNHAWTYYYYDKTEMNNEAIAHKNGIFNYLGKRKGFKYKM
ncbi:hypothetical protein FACS189485_19950 [Spirochaetia bacterium]|nr:hypothetical protein FACS189485_19950 [Spirochaetia bacterium]